jgi:AcrR family transcriptional regulator
MAKRVSDSQVYEATIKTLLAQGYAGATTKLIAEQAGVNEVTLFRRYGSKAQLVSAAVAHERLQLETEALGYSGDIVADLGQIVQLYCGATPRQSQLMLIIMAEMARYPELKESLQVPYRLIMRFGRLIARYQEEGVLQSGDPILIVGALLGPVIVNTMLRSADPTLNISPIDRVEHIKRFLEGYGQK